MPLSPDPMLEELTNSLKGVTAGKPEEYAGQLHPILSNQLLFGVNLYDVGLGKKIEGMFLELIAGKHAVRTTLEK